MADLHMTTRPGYQGLLNDVILRRVRFVSHELSLPDLEQRFAHLHDTAGAWRRRAAPVAAAAAANTKRSNSSGAVNLAAYIDHTQLRADAPHASIVQLCEEAKRYGFATVCVNAHYVPMCVRLLAGTPVRVGGSVGFPLGQTSTAVKVAEAADEVAHGAHEVDMVLNVAELKEGNYRFVYDEICAVCAACGPGVTTKVIFETCLLHDKQQYIIDAAVLSVAAGAHFVKTSTGFSSGGATPEAVDIMLAVVGPAARVKVSGGVRDRATALQYVQAGVARIGTSAGVAICAPTTPSSL